MKVHNRKTDRYEAGHVLKLRSLNRREQLRALVTKHEDALKNIDELRNTDELADQGDQPGLLQLFE